MFCLRDIRKSIPGPSQKVLFLLKRDIRWGHVSFMPLSGAGAVTKREVVNTRRMGEW